MNHRLPALGGRQQPGKSQKMNGMLQWFKNLHNVEHLETTKTKGSLETDSKPRSRWLQMLKMASTTLDSHVKKRGAGSESLAVSWGDYLWVPNSHPCKLYSTKIPSYACPQKYGNS